MKIRPVDKALEQELPEKKLLRNKWVDAVKEAEKYHSGNDKYPLYVTLSGPEGKDIELLIKNNIIKITENGAINSDDQWKVVAIEKNGPKATELRNKFPGLKVKDSSVFDLLNDNCNANEKLNNSFLWGASVINLDYNSRLEGIIENDRCSFDVIITLKKISEFQLSFESKYWCVLLTLNANLVLDDIFWNEIIKTLKNNRYFNSEFCNEVDKSEYFKNIDDIYYSSVSKIKDCDKLQQKFVLNLVPNLFSQKIKEHCWEFSVIKAFSYGNNTSGRSRMASWILCLKQKSEDGLQKDLNFENQLSNIINYYQIDQDGKSTPQIR